LLRRWKAYGSWLGPYSISFCVSDFDLAEDGLEASVASVGELRSPMSDGTIEEDFEAALARESTNKARQVRDDYYLTSDCF